MATPYKRARAALYDLSEALADLHGDAVGEAGNAEIAARGDPGRLTETRDETRAAARYERAKLDLASVNAALSALDIVDDSLDAIDGGPLT